MDTPKMKQLRNDIPIVLGNMKLPVTTAVLNVSPASLCTSRMLGLCQLRDPDKQCYALSEERRFRNTCIPSRQAMQCYWDSNPAWQIAGDLLGCNQSKRTKITALRINECGDFRHQADLDKAEMVARFLLKSGVATYCYTARRDLDYAQVVALTVNGSGWMAHNQFQVLYPDGKGGHQDKSGTPVQVDGTCPGSCRKCTRCLVKGRKVIGVKLH